MTTPINVSNPLKATGDIFAIRDWFNASLYNKNEIDQFFIENNDYSAYEVTIKGKPNSKVSITGRTSGKVYDILLMNSEVTKMLFFTEGETIDAVYNPEIELLTPIMTSATTPSGEVSSSSYLTSSYPPWRAFNRSEESRDGWHSNSSPTPHWIQYEFDAAKVVTKIGIQNFVDLTTHQAPRTFVLKGSNDGETFTSIGEFNVTSLTSGAKQEWDVQNSTAYTYYRLEFTSLEGNYVALANVYLYGSNTITIEKVLDERKFNIDFVPYIETY